MPTHRTGRRTSIAIVGGDTLLGKEVHELLDARKIPANIQLVASFEPEDSTAATNILAIGKEEPLVMTSIQAADLATAKIVILAASKESGHQVYKKIQTAKPAPVVLPSPPVASTPTTPDTASEP